MPFLGQKEQKLDKEEEEDKEEYDEKKSHYAIEDYKRI